MKYLFALLLASSSVVHAAEPILVWGTKYSYNKSDFEPKTVVNGNIYSYTSNIEMLLDEYDDFIGDYPVLTFDLSAEIMADAVPYPIPLSLVASCENDSGRTETLGLSQSILIEKYNFVLPARMNVFNRVKTDGACKQLRIDIVPHTSELINLDAIIKSIRFDALILSDAL
ncbi:hypothetical protein [Pseudoalteromonas piscicida]|uniref:hypothetical protein n=1 Tax=Pseudoalteromonas piscicida TaxID=43662 RepID=UPI0005FA0BFF|nr:hypothetical protein [Pseudoalteromonas piscicida]KJY96736.1 hypothetical protein TW73_15995 [Pseudoalteromonas piscicida]